MFSSIRRAVIDDCQRDCHAPVTSALINGSEGTNTCHFEDRHAARRRLPLEWRRPKYSCHSEHRHAARRRLPMEWRTKQKLSFWASESAS